MATPVVIVEAGGLGVTNVEDAWPLTPYEGESKFIGFPVTLMEAGGIPVSLVNEDFTAWEAAP